MGSMNGFYHNMTGISIFFIHFWLGKFDRCYFSRYGGNRFKKTGKLVQKTLASGKDLWYSIKHRRTSAANRYPSRKPHSKGGASQVGYLPLSERRPSWLQQGEHYFFAYNPFRFPLSIQPFRVLDTSACLPRKYPGATCKYLHR